MGRNIKIAYVLAFLRYFWLWLGVWVYYYLRFTDYAGIGLIESVMIITQTSLEIPTGAVADLIGKSNTLAIAFLFGIAGNLLMAFTPNYSLLVLSVVFLGLCGALSSGSFEAFVYDSLKQDRKETLFDRVIANVGSIQLVSFAFGGFLSGLLYTIDPRLPFVGVGVAYMIGFILTFYLKEPQVDTLKFSFKSFVNQNKQGIMQLKNLLKVEDMALFIIVISSIWVISDEMMESFLSVEFGFTEKIIGIFTSIVFLIAAGASKLSPVLNRKYGARSSLIITASVMALAYATSPLAGIIVGGISIALRESSARIFQNLALVVFNKRIESKYRATAISSFNMLKSIPYVLTAYLLGLLMQSISARNFALVMGVLIGILVVLKLFKKPRVELVISI